MPSRPTIGVLVDWIDDAYHAAVLAGIADAAREAGANLLCFAGGVLRSPLRASHMRNHVYDLAGEDTLDGLIVMGALGNTVGAAGLAQFCHRFEPLPIVTIAVPIEGCPSVLVDNARGMRDALLHLVDAHGKRRIAFIRGPAANVEAEGRLQIYREVLAERGLELDPALVSQGDFERSSGEAAAASLVDRGVSFDAIAAASDAMALGAMDALRSRGVRVPQSVAVVGFDDVTEARLAVPPLTTVRQPLDEEGRRATAMLLAAIEGRGDVERVELHTRLVTRRSCGCAPAASALERAGAERAGVSACEAPSAERGSRAAAEMMACLGPSRDRVLRDAEPQLVARADEALAAEIGGGAPGTFLAALEDALRARVVSRDDVGSWQEALSALRRATLRRDGRPREAELAEELFQEARVLVARYSEVAQAAERSRVERLAQSLAETGESLMGSFDRQKLLEALTGHLPRLGIPAAFLSVYRDEKAPSARARLILAFDSARGGDPLPSGITFHTRSLLPPGMLPEDRRWSFLVEPLFFKDDALGFMLLEMGPREGIVYEALRDQVSAAIAGAELVAKVVAHDGERQRLLRYVLDVTPDMHRVQPPADLYPTVLDHAIGMLEAARADAAPAGGSLSSYFPPPALQGFFAAVEGQALVVRASTGPFTAGEPVERSLDGAALSLVRDGMRARSVAIHQRCTVLPLALGELLLGVIYVEHGTAAPPDVALLSTFANQASAAIRNMQLYEMAALDPLTGTHARRFFEEWLHREVQAAWRSRHPVSLLMIDTDGMKRINDTAGHLAGDEALATIGKVLRTATRQNDVVGRYGGDEFAVVLPHTRSADAEQVAGRILQTLEGRSVRGPDGALPLRISVGASTLLSESLPEPEASVPLGEASIKRMVEKLIARADAALYTAKRSGGMRLVSSTLTDWE